MPIGLHPSWKSNKATPVRAVVKWVLTHKKGGSHWGWTIDQQSASKQCPGRKLQLLKQNFLLLFKWKMYSLLVRLLDHYNKKLKRSLKPILEELEKPLPKRSFEMEASMKARQTNNCPVIFEENDRKEAFGWKSFPWCPKPPGACQNARPEVMLVWGAPHAGPWDLVSPLAFSSATVPLLSMGEKGKPIMQPPPKVNAHSPTKQDFLFYHRFYAKYAERIRRARQSLLLLLIVIKTCNVQGAAAILLIQFTVKMGACYQW